MLSISMLLSFNPQILLSMVSIDRILKRLWSFLWSQIWTWVEHVPIFCSGNSAKARGLLYPLMKYLPMTRCTLPCDKSSVYLCVWAWCSQNGQRGHKMFGCFTKVKRDLARYERPLCYSPSLMFVLHCTNGKHLAQETVKLYKFCLATALSC